jgi:hypothetical protein
MSSSPPAAAGSGLLDHSGPACPGPNQAFELLDHHVDVLEAIRKVRAWQRTTTDSCKGSLLDARLFHALVHAHWRVWTEIIWKKARCRQPLTDIEREAIQATLDDCAVATARPSLNVSYEAMADLVSASADYKVVQSLGC